MIASAVTAAPAAAEVAVLAELAVDDAVVAELAVLDAPVVAVVGGVPVVDVDWPASLSTAPLLHAASSAVADVAVRPISPRRRNASLLLIRPSFQSRPISVAR